MILRVLLLLVSLFSCGTLCVAEEPSPSDEDVQYFERKIRPILVNRCYACHSIDAKVLHGGFRLDTASLIHKGGDSGRAIVSGHPEESLLIDTIQYDSDIQMPPKGKLPDAEIKELTHWVKRGAHFPESLDVPEKKSRVINFVEGAQFWSFQPLREQSLPVVEKTQWLKNRIDSFTLHSMEREELQPALSTDRTTLIRRLSFDLTGLPPTPEDVQAFVSDESPKAYENLIERFMASPQYGEKWARIWLDLARYTDRTEDWLLQDGLAYFYRDWVVKALNDDMPYDEFVHRQLAADLMPGANPQDLTALGFVGLSPTYWKELQLPCEIIKMIVADEWEERVDAVTSTFLGLTVACARCHDHKFDPISSEDYYGLAGVFASSRQIGRPLISEEQYQPVREAKAEIIKIQGEVTLVKAQIAALEADKAKQQQATESKQNSVAVETPSEKTIPADEAPKASPATPQEKLEQLTAKIEELKSTPLFDTPLTNALSEESTFVERAGASPQEGTRFAYRPGPQDLPLFSRGDPNRPGEIVRRRFLTVLTPKPRPFENGSGRLELAHSMTSDAAPLAARVMVNRIWLAHFGQGIVNTPSNFGIQGSPPSHPELLEDLAFRFIANGWSIKWLHREILLSATWQQSTECSDRAKSIDPGNRWLSHMNRRRHDFEAWRDSMLSASGVLDRTLGGPSRDLEEQGNHRRTLYCTIHRRELSTTFQIHDFPDPNQHSSQRFSTTTALQGLYALNGPLFSEQSQALVTRLQREHPDNEAAQINRASWLLFSRPPTAVEQTLCLAYLSDSTGEERTNRWKQYTHALLASNETLFLD